MIVVKIAIVATNHVGQVNLIGECDKDRLTAAFNIHASIHFLSAFLFLFFLSIIITKILSFLRQ